MVRNQQKICCATSHFLFYVTFVVASASSICEAITNGQATTLTIQATHLLSGPGEEYYPTQNVGGDVPVQIVTQRADGWVGIIPPAGSYSWARRQDVQLHSSQATVTVEKAYVRVGSVLNPNRSAVQIALHHGDHLQLLSPQPGDDPQWLRCIPPAGELRWIHASRLQMASETNSSVSTQTADRVQQLQRRLTEINALPVAQQNFVQIKQEALNLLRDSASRAERKQLRELLDAIDQQQVQLVLANAAGMVSQLNVDDAVVSAQYQSVGGPGQMTGMPGRASNRGMPSFNQSATQRTPSSFTVRLARAPNMMGDFFGNTGTTNQYFQSIGELGVADPLLGDPTVVSYVEPFVDINGTTQYDYENFGVLLIDSEQNYNNDGIPDFALSADLDQIAISELDPDGDYAAISNGIVTPSLHDLYELFEIYQLTIPSPGDIVGRVRLSENNSALPQDRIFFDYSYFHNVPLTSDDIEVHRFAPGAERTFLDGMASVELRVPMGISMSSDIVADSPADVTQGEFGNIVISPKVLIYDTGEFAFAAGCGVALPTADDLLVTDSTNRVILMVQNEATHLLPYLAALYAPQESPFFVHAFLTLDLDLAGNSVFADPDGDGIQKVGELTDQNLLSTHLAVGSWVYQNRNRGARLTGIALSSELHTTSTLNDADTITVGSSTLGNPDADLSMVNATFGAHAQVCMTTFTAGYCTPLTSDRVFDGELRVFVNRNF